MVGGCAIERGGGEGDGDPWLHYLAHPGWMRQYVKQATGSLRDSKLGLRQHYHLGAMKGGSLLDATDVD